MPHYKVQLKQGSRTIVEYIEAPSVSSVLSFYESITTMKVTEVLKIEYEYEGSVIPPDDFQYQKIYRALVKENSTGSSRQVIFHNIKPSVSSTNMAALIKSHLEIGGMNVDSVLCNLMKAD